MRHVAVAYTVRTDPGGVLHINVKVTTSPGSQRDSQDFHLGIEAARELRDDLDKTLAQVDAILGVVGKGS